MESSEFEDIQYKIYLATSPNAIQGNDPAKISEAVEYTKNLKDDPEGLTLCLNNFVPFNEIAKKFTLETLTYWLERRFSEIPSDIVSDILEFLSVTAIEQIHAIGANGTNGVEVLAEAQATFTLKTYLEIFPDVIERFFIFEEDKIKQSASFRYIIHLFKQLTTPTPNSLELHRSIIQKMTEDGSLDAITEVVQSKLSQKNDFAVKVIIYYSRFWENGDAFIDDEFFANLAEDLEFEGFEDNVPLVYLSLLQRQEDKKSFTDFLKLNDLFAQVCENPTYSNSVLRNFGNLLSYCGYTFTDSKEYYEFAIQIASVVSKKVTTSLLNYINSYTLWNPDNIEDTLNFAIKRIKLHYEKCFEVEDETSRRQIPRNPDFNTNFVQSLQEVCVNCFALNQEISEKILVSFLTDSENIFEDIPSLIALVLVIYSLTKSRITIVQIESFVPFLTQLMQNASSGELFEDQFSVLYLAFFNIALSFNDFYPTLILFSPEDIFRGIIPYTLNDNILQYRFQKLLVQCCLKHGVQNNINADDFESFSELPMQGTGLIYGSLVNCVPEEDRPSVTQQTVEKIQESIKGEPDENLLLFSMGILSTMKTPFEEEILQSVLSVVNELLSSPAIQGNDHLLSKAIKGISSLNLSGTEIFLEFYPNASTIESLSSLAKLAASIRRIASLQESAIEANIPNSDPGLQIALDKSWVPKFGTFLVEQLQNFNTSVQLFEKNEVGNYFEFLNSIVLFMKNDLELFEPADVMVVANTIIDEVNMFFDDPEMNNAMLNFAVAITPIDDQEIIDVIMKYIQISLNFLYTQNIVLLSSEWNKVLMNLLAFYKIVNESMQPDFQAAFTEAANAIGATEWSVQQFLEALSNSNPDEMLQLMDSAIDFCSQLLNNRIYI